MGFNWAFKGLSSGILQKHFSYQLRFWRVKCSLDHANLPSHTSISEEGYVLT